MFTVTDDFPTPPLPEAIAMIEVLGAKEILVGPCEFGPRSLPTRASRCSGDIGVRLTSTRSTPMSGCTAAVTSCVIRSRSGHPSIVSRTSTRTLPPSTWIPWSIPMSSIGLPISGSSTSRSATRTSASLAMTPVYGRHLASDHPRGRPSRGPD